MVKKIPLHGKHGEGKFVLVDDDDYLDISRYGLVADKSKNKIYVAMYIEDEKGSRRKKTRLHVYLMKPPKGYHVDHINGDTLDNRRSNLRVCVNQQNSMNRKPRKNGSSIYKGVSYNSRTGKWESYINFNYKKIHLGFYDNEIDAAKAYDQAAIQLFGEFARLNFPEDYPDYAV